MIKVVNSHANYQSTNRTEKLEHIKKTHEESKEKQYVQIMSQVQATLEIKTQESSFEVDYQEFKDFLKDIGYEGKSIASLSKQEATELVSEDGFFGIEKTSMRIAEFVLVGAGSDEQLLREGKKGVLQGFKEAEAMWGDKLPDISYETLDKALSMIDKALMDNGFSVLDEKV